ncbi:sll0787 family AIR synthase-like protein [Sphingobium sp.]|uniref:sll0787 family AIR synthase-like protein n=1 Tax=Sphingobium sp. TaxID=1912891 RepID=UPI003B3AE70E
MTDIASLVRIIRDSRGLMHKGDIAPVMRRLGIGGEGAVPVGDDTAAIPDGDGHLLFAIEGFVEDFVAADPWFAGYCGVMVNVSDVLAMGGRPLAIVDALWCDGDEGGARILAGMREAARRYHVPVVGGHSNLRSAAGQLAVAILGRADDLVTSFGAQPGDALLVATDLGGRFRDPFPWWDASTGADDAHIAGLLPILPDLAADSLLTAAKDISMAGVVGTAIMLADASRVGMTIDLDALPRPAGQGLERWLTAFPSFGFIMTAKGHDVPRIIERFARGGVACAQVGTVTQADVAIAHDGEAATVWTSQTPLIGCHAKEPAHA